MVGERERGRAGTQGRAKPRRQRESRGSRAGIRGGDGGTAGPGPPGEGWDPPCAWSTRSSISCCFCLSRKHLLCGRSSCVDAPPVCTLLLCSFNTDLQTLLCFTSAAFLKFETLVDFFLPCTLAFIPLLWLPCWSNRIPSAAVTRCSGELTRCRLSRGRRSCGERAQCRGCAPSRALRPRACRGSLCCVRRVFLRANAVLGQPGRWAADQSKRLLRRVRLWYVPVGFEPVLTLGQKSRYVCAAVLVVQIHRVGQKRSRRLSPG